MAVFQLKSILIIGFAIAITFIYAYTRYVVFGVFEAENMLAFVANKSIAFAAVLLVPFFITTGKQLYRYTTNTLIILHISMSLYMLHPTFYPSLFDHADMMNMVGIMVVSLGIAGAFFFFNALSKQFVEIPPMVNTLLLLLAILLHNTFIGYQAWFEPSIWNGSMPPITLLSSISILVSIVLIGIKMVKRKVV